MLHPPHPLQVILGGGRKYMTPKGTPDPEYPNNNQTDGIREDGENLIDMWLEARPVGDMSGTVLCPLSLAQGQAPTNPLRDLPTGCPLCLEQDRDAGCCCQLQCELFDG